MFSSLVLFRYCSLESASSSGAKSKSKKKGGGSFTESLEALRANPKVASLATLVASYGISHRLFEFAWKGQVNLTIIAKLQSFWI